jgi:MOSC domain-containing protein YiiM
MGSAIVTQVSISPGGVPKRAIPQGSVGLLGVAGDVQKHTKYHGGPQQALLLICQEGLDELTALGFTVFPGALGENLTIQGLDRRALRLGDQLRIGNTVRIEITKMREPCSQLDPYGAGIQKHLYDAQVRNGDPSSPRWGLGGFYCKVLTPGDVRAGDSVIRETS